MLSPPRFFPLSETVRGLYFIVFIALALIGIGFRALRYRILIRASGEPEQNIPTPTQIVLITAVRGMVVDLVPARLGELIYVLLLKKVSNTSVATGLSSLLFAMAFDVAILAPITILLGVFIGFPNTAPLQISVVVLAVVACMYIGIRFVLPRLVSYLGNSKVFHSRFLEKLTTLIIQINHTIQSTIKAGVFLKVLMLTLVVRGLKYLGLLMLFHSVAVGSYPELTMLSNLQVLTAMIASEMTAALPIPTLMSFGAWEVGGMTFMALFGAAPRDSLLTLLSVHILTQSVDYGIGLVALFLILTRRKKVEAPSQRTSQWTLTKNTYAVLFCIIATALALFTWYGFSRSGQDSADSDTPSIALENRPEWLQQLDGFIVWSSNRMGNHNIMAMELSTLTIKPLTIHPNTETHPRISPDGTKVAFIRSKAKWQSWRDQKPWEVWILNLENNTELKIADSGTAPTWSGDGKKVYFNRSVGEIWEYDIEAKTQTKLYQRNTQGLPDTELFWPSIDDKGVLAVSFKDHGRPTNIIADGTGDLTVVARGCMLTWSPDNQFALFVSNSEGGRQQNQFNRYDRSTGEISKLLDLPGKLSHEYFPRLDQSQEFLVFAASDGAHEPDIEDYEIFIWKTDTPHDQAQRLTFDFGNDSWPDIFIRSE